MKKVLIVTEGFNVGGVEKSLETFLKDYNKTNVTVLCLTYSSAPINLNDNIKIVYVNQDQLDYSYPLFEALKKLIKRKKFILCIKRICLAILAKLKYKKITTYRYTSTSMYYDIQNEIYDLAIAFKDGLSWYYVNDFVNANNKIAWNHTNIKKIDCSKKYTKFVLEKYDFIYSVSRSSAELMKNYLHLDTNVDVFYNYIDQKSIILKSNTSQNIQFNNNVCNIVTVGRICDAKGQVLIIDICKLLKENGFKYNWYLIGDGQDNNKIKNKIEKYDLSDFVFLTGSIDNPYPYMKNCDLYVQPSKYEGFGLTLSEAKIISKRIIASNIPQFLEQDDGNIFYTSLNKKELFDVIINYLDVVPDRIKNPVILESTKDKFINLIS